MSNAAQFFPIGKRLGESVTLTYNGDSFTASDGTVWKATTPVPLAYSSIYAGLITDAPELLTACTTMNGPLVANTWGGMLFDCICGGTGGGATWLMVPTTSNIIPYYWTSTDAGATWTRRAIPVTGKTWKTLWDGTNFVMYADITGATGVQESTDGITWTARTGISFTVRDFIFANSLYVALGNATTLATSTDRTTWTSRTMTAQSAVNNGRTGGGSLTWNAGAGLWITGTTTAGTIQTSPDAITWTNRTVFNDNPNLITLASVVFASNATTTIAVGLRGTYAYSTDGINWTYGKIDADYQASSPIFAFHDGTQFVVYVLSGIAYYSTSGTGSWVRATRGKIFGGAPTRMPGGHFGTSSDTAMKSTDITSTTNTNIIHPSPVARAVAQPYVRIL